jgi:hypothetical protein
MKALSIKQPWASLIAHGIKDIENRTWKTKFRGRVYIHASAKIVNEVDFTVSQSAQLWLNGFPQTTILSTDNRFPISAIIGEVDIIDCVINHPSIWAEKTPYREADDFMDEADERNYYKNIEPNIKPIYNWVLTNPILYDKPILNVKGKLSFWDIDKNEIIKNAYGRFYNPEYHHYSVSGYSDPEAYSEEEFYDMMQEINLEVGNFRCRPKILNQIFKNV